MFSVLGISTFAGSFLTGSAFGSSFLTGSGLISSLGVLFMEEIFTFSCKQTARLLKPLEILKTYFLFSVFKARIAKTSSTPELKVQPIKF